MTADSTAPTFVSAATSSDGAQTTITCCENLNTSTAPTTAFNVGVDRSAAPLTQPTTNSNDFPWARFLSRSFSKHRD